MEQKLKILIPLLLGLMLSACSAGQQQANQPTINESTESVTAMDASAASTAITKTTAPIEESVPEATPALEEAVQATPLYRMNNTYRFEPIDSSVQSKVVLLTFDDGPKDEAVLTSILDTLDKHKAKAIFFVNGYRIKQNPELLKLIDSRGQTVGNHSYDHINLKNEPKEVVEQQISDVQSDVEALINKKPQFFRPPYGSGGDTVKEIAKNHGMLFMTWSNGSLDWDKSARDKPEEVIRNVLEQLHPGANILMHELKWTAEALDELLTTLELKGYGFIDPASIEINL